MKITSFTLGHAPNAKAIELKVNRVAIDKNVVTKPSPFSHQYFTIKHALNGFEHENSKNKNCSLGNMFKHESIYFEENIV